MPTPPHPGTDPATTGEAAADAGEGDAGPDAAVRIPGGPNGLRVSALPADDADRAVPVVQAGERWFTGRQRTSAGEMQGLIARVSEEGGRCVQVCRDGGCVGVGIFDPVRRSELAVDPRLEPELRRVVLDELLRQLVLAPGPAKLQVFAEDRLFAERLTEHGFTPTVSALSMTREVARLPAVPPVPGFRLRPGDPDAEIQALHSSQASVWEEVRGHQLRDLEGLHAALTAQAQLRPTLLLVAEPASTPRPIGAVQASVFDDGMGWVSLLWVGRVDGVDHRGRGVGRALLSYAMTELVTMGATSLGIGVYLSNHRALGLYRSMGFEPKDYRDQWEHAG